MNGDANLKWGLLLGIAWTSKYQKSEDQAQGAIF